MRDLSQAPKRGSRVDYGYDCYSDLEDSEDVVVHITSNLGPTATKNLQVPVIAAQSEIEGVQSFIVLRCYFVSLA